MNDSILSAIEQYKIIAIVRGVSADACMPVAEALYAGGIRLMEITYNQSAPETWEQTADAIGEISDAFQGRMAAGAGTVTNTRLVEMTASAGGKYIISPNTNVEVIRRTKDLGLVSIPGAMTPSEILTAHDAGADYVKLFPASELGIGYLKAIRAPISHVKLVATGGINETNARAFLEAGSVGLGVGGGLANKRAIAEGNYAKLTEAARTLLAAIS
ncbi:MAG: bifunctional 4-hydroxy-2-oxoglutarate aldolase/2-dehydro-3-deoxy-phosphogluconate aldolase [Oscillospiraceae bacterium]|nr:bifunctional 4-hydroxy-2-oxoglutarate aldolase/2-dehydro-3-deoxy-phosphogluconate aldolase [Oscillospiraceae bacterium]